ncbi:serpin family protein [Nitrosarchaeum sp. AC2]|uniref:serpin family protein n=1 Tax=Nitrosarchaeum sp. AC2 TaxID=2259673 RepID=UPI0015C77DF3|nr:serpin family protein [Nitrosarchaeum sp. AC2]QLH10814.1 hypothetical protein DSQ20_04525 [Nitrosarchaeum sp. AC2]
MKTRLLIIFGILTSLLIGVPNSDAFFEEGMVIEVPGQIMDISNDVISPEQTMFVNGTFNQSVDNFTANIFKDYEDSSKLVLTLSPTSNEFGNFNFNFTIPQDWEFGNYHIVLENGLQFMNWEFTIRKNHTGISLDRTVYPVPWETTSPLKQIKKGVALIDIQCPDEKHPVYKYNRMRVACVSEETQNELWNRGWATMRLSMSDDDISHALCNNYEGKWHPEYEGCRDVTVLQCSLMGGKFVDNLKICYNDICPENRTYTVCVTNFDKLDSHIVSEPYPMNFDPADIKEHIDANNQFAIDFYSNLTQNDSVSNVFFSPTSISTAFSILYEGARQNTSQEIQNVFGFPEDDNIRKQGYLSLHQSINKKSNTDTTVSIANALWLAENFEPLAEYINTATTYYDSTVSTVDFVSDEGVNKINEWVDNKTQGKIPDILKPGSTDSNTKMAITNAIYFKGLWEYQFDPEDTYESEFMIDKDNSVNMQMMTFPHKMQVNYTITETMEMIELPYRNGTMSLLVILPNEIDNLRTVEKSITIDNLKMWKDFPTMNRGINIHIPKFTLETEYDLTKSLPDMGMPTVFNPVHADLSGITGYKSLYVSQAIHKAFVEVNEKGTEAAGATVIVTDESGGPTFRADHPFIFIIQDNETGNILFMGRVVDPT